MLDQDAKLTADAIVCAYVLLMFASFHYFYYISQRTHPFYVNFLD